MIGLPHVDSHGDSVAVWTAPSTVVIGAGHTSRGHRDALIAERWFRARPDAQAEMVARPGVRRIGGTEAHGPLGPLTRAVADFAAVSVNATDTDVWEIDQRSGLVRRSAPIVPPAPVGEGLPLQDSIDPVSLRGKDLAEWDWQAEGLIDPVAPLLASHLTEAVGWTTLAPASGSTATRTGTGVGRLTWSGQSDTMADSRASAVVEGIERLVGSRQASDDYCVAAAAELSGRAVTPLDYDAYPEEAYGAYLDRYDPEALHEWVTGESLQDGSPVWIPREFVFYGEHPSFGRWGFGTSSGCATGSSLAEASLFGLLELIERDTFVNAWYGQIPAIPIDPATVPSVADMLARLRLFGWTAELALLRNAWRIPVMVAVVSTGDVHVYGAAAHLDSAIAARRALTEAVAYTPARQDEVALRAVRVAQLIDNPRAAATIDDHPLLPVTGADPAYRTFCGDPSRARSLADLADVVSSGVLAAAQPRAGRSLDAQHLLAALVEELTASGIETFRVIPSSSLGQRLGLTTVMTLAPGLSQLDFGWQRQRVRTSDRPLREARRISGSAAAALRPLPHPFS